MSDTNNKDDAKSRIYALCLQVFHDEGDGFSMNAVSRRSPGTNKNTVIKYVNQFKSLIPIIVSMPHSSFDTWEAVKALDDANKNLKETLKDVYLDEIADLSQKLEAAETVITELKNSASELEHASALLSEENLQLTLKAEKIESDKDSEIKDIKLSLSNAQHEHDKVFAVMDCKHQSTIDSLQNEISHHVERYNTLAEHAKKSEKSHTDREAELKSQQDSAVKKITGLESKTKELELYAVTLDHQLAASEKNVNEQAVTVSALKKEASDLKENEKSMTASNHDFQRLTVTQQDRIAALVIQLRELETKKVPSFDEYLGDFEGDSNFDDVIKQHKTQKTKRSKEYRMAVAQYEKKILTGVSH